MIKHWHRGAMAAGSFLLLVLTPVHAADPPGVLWQTTSQMVMEGMPYSPPPNTQTVCAAKEWTRPPPGGDSTCVTTNYKRVGNKATWTMQCSGQMPMSGTGEITFDGADSYTGTITATADGMNVRIQLSGKKMGTCDQPIS
jgi:hypothetical protein